MVSSNLFVVRRCISFWQQNHLIKNINLWLDKIFLIRTIFTKSSTWNIMIFYHHFSFPFVESLFSKHIPSHYSILHRNKFNYLYLSFCTIPLTFPFEKHFSTIYQSSNTNFASIGIWFMEYIFILTMNFSTKNYSCMVSYYHIIL